MKKNKQQRHQSHTKKKGRVARAARATKRQRGGICPCVMQQQQRQKGGFAITLMNQFTTAASLLTPIAAALGIKAYRDTKKKTRRAR
jgi:hypothetical protein